MPARLSWRPAICGAGTLLICAFALGGPSLPPTHLAKPLGVDPPIRAGTETPIQLAAARPTDPGPSDSVPASLPFTPLAVDALFDPPRFDEPPVSAAREGPVSATPQALSVPIPAFGAVGVMGVGGAMCWLGARWLRIRR